MLQYPSFMYGTEKRITLQEVVSTLVLHENVG